MQLSKIPLRLVLIVPFVLQLLITVGIVSGLSFYNSQEAVHHLVTNLLGEVRKNIHQHLNTHLTLPILLSKLNAQAVEDGKLQFGNPDSERYLWQLSELTGTINWISFGRESDGGFLGVSRHRRRQGDIEIIIVDETTNHGAEYYLADSQGRRGKLNEIISKRFDSRSRSWYQRAAAAGSPVWSDVFFDWSTGRTRIDAVVPAYDKQKKLLGVCQAAFYLEDISTFLKTLPLTQSGMAFVVETSGLLIANSVMEIPFTKDENDISQRKYIRDSQHALMHAIANKLPDQFDYLSQPQQQIIELETGHYFTQLIPYKAPIGGGIDWVIGIVVPEKDFMAPIWKSNHFNLILLVLTVLISIIIGFFTARWITQPVFDLNQAAKLITRKQWEFNLPASVSIKELGQLLYAFKQMSEQLQQAFTALTENEQRLQQFLEAMPVGVFVIAPTGEPYYINTRAQQLLGKEIVNQHVKCDKLPDIYQVYLAGTDLLYPSDKQPIYRALAKKPTYVDDMEIRSFEQNIPIEAWGTPILNEEGEVIYGLAVFQDIKVRKQAEVDKIRLALVEEASRVALSYQYEIEDKNQTLIHLNQEKNEFLGIVAHDLKNPLSGIRGIAEFLQEDVDSFSKDEISDYARLIVGEADRMFQLITNLLDVNAIESGKLNIILENADILPIVQKLVKNYIERAKEKNIQVYLDIPNSACQVMTDKNIVEQIFDNLISNAIKYSPANKSVYVQIVQNTGTFQFEVKDEGPGLSQADQEKLFGKFTRLNPKPTAGEHSTGLGLYIVKRLVETIQAQVWCESEEGQGAKFIVAFANTH